MLNKKIAELLADHYISQKQYLISRIEELVQDRADYEEIIKKALETYQGVGDFRDNIELINNLKAELTKPQSKLK
jgi:hypothetical protein